MNVVSNTGPLIALAKVDQLGLLQQLFGKVNIPPAVHRELLAKTGPEAPRLDQALTAFIEISNRPPFNPEVKIATSRLDWGEREAVALARQLDALLLIDDRLGRQAARLLKVEVSGVVGVLIRSKRAGLLGLVHPILLQMREQGYWVSDGLVEVAARLADEPPPKNP